jgi:hypothetical protein
MKLAMIVTALCMTISAIPARSAENRKTKMMPMPEMSATQRQEMATAHEKMASCLRSERAIKDCHKEMMAACKDSMGNNSCPMMGKGKKHDRGQIQSDESEE